MSGLESVLARIGAIERMVSAVHVPTVVGDAPGGSSFAAALVQATLAEPAGSPPTVAATTRTATGRGGTTPGAAGQGATTPIVATAGVALPIVAVSGAATSIVTQVTPATEARSGTPSTRPSDNRAPHAVDPSYRPGHVTETDERVWNDCTWASASMWIDKLTGGAVKVDREALRAASGDRTGGSSLGDVVRGARKLLGLDLRAAHAERLTVDGLLDRLASGGGAIVQGSYASLPSSLTRNDPGFAARGVASSGHAVYVGPLNRATGKVWWDDPLAPAGASGRWISVKDLKKFMWTDAHGRVSALATPAGTAAATGTAGRGGAHRGMTASAAPAASVSVAARSTGVDPLLLTAFLDVTRTPSDSRAITGGAGELAAALTRYGRADLALESLGAAQAGSTRLAEGAVFAGDVLSEWAALLERQGHS